MLILEQWAGPLFILRYSAGHFFKKIVIERNTYHDTTTDKLNERKRDVKVLSTTHRSEWGKNVMLQAYQGLSVNLWIR